MLASAQPVDIAMSQAAKSTFGSGQTAALAFDRARNDKAITVASLSFKVNTS